MPTLSTMQVVITIVAVIAGILSFGLYFAMTMNWLKPDAQKASEDTLQHARDSAKSLVGPSAADVADMLKSLATLTESLIKAGPALWSLIGSALFLLIASIAAGLLSPGSGHSSTEGSNAADVSNGQTDADQPANENVPVK